MSAPVSTGFETLLSHFTTLITTFPPPFIHINDPNTPRISAALLRSSLASISVHTSESTPRIAYACLNAVACFTPRLLYDTALNALAGWTPQWEDGCENWTDDTGQRFNENVDGFVHGLKAVHSWYLKHGRNKDEGGDGKGKGKAKDSGGIVRLVVLIERAERLKENVPDMVVPLTRLAELAQLDVTVIFHSDLQWDQIRPTLGASPEPFYMSVPALSKQTILERLADAYPPPEIGTSKSSLVDENSYHPALQRLFVHFVSNVHSVCSPFVTDPAELAYIIAARWPGFVQPLLDEWRRSREERQEELRLQREGGDDDDEREDVDMEEEKEHEIELGPPSENTRLRLTRLFASSLTEALESLYPRLTYASTWIRSHAPPTDLLAYHPRDIAAVLQKHRADNNTSNRGDSGKDGEEAAIPNLPRMAKFILVAAFVASTNPTKTDMRMLGRGLDERTKRRRKSVSPRKKTGVKQSAVKIPQRLLGPLAFPLDRLLAILGVLLEENDAEARPPMPEYTVPGEYTEIEIARVAVYAQVHHLSSMHLLHRTSPADRMELSPTFKCGISYEVALRLAKDIDVALNDMLWDPV
ncbi:origin recognition complex subunit 5 C-terminus-domain-containing protein [Cristinia sonorae]|uniref:Origin recognition complex subunit 5 C-terminus-domain-containing protein n=1 Tax=Cristinia sonorae TaxID=1940300 RepID=A0A8K0USJ8_9AGAR|nr:origin recognition complex subunit 5 C-terminus-domain-containing protein [Cristinia sonorae]